MADKSLLSLIDQLITLEASLAVFTNTAAQIRKIRKSLEDSS